MIKNVLFDIDGVLVDSENAHFSALRESLRFHGFTNFSLELYHKFGTISSKSKLIKISEELRLGWGSEKIEAINKMKSKYLNLDLVKFNPNINQIIKLLNNKNIKWGLVTNARYQFAQQIVAHYNVTPDCLISNSDGILGKPSPDPYFLALSRLGANSKETLVYEDSLEGIKSARLAACHVNVINSYMELTEDKIEKDLFLMSLN